MPDGHQPNSREPLLCPVALFEAEQFSPKCHGARDTAKAVALGGR